MDRTLPMACTRTNSLPRSLPSLGGLIVSLSLLLLGCQPPDAQQTEDAAQTKQSKKDDNLPAVLISADSVTITQDHLLNIKFKRYQPSLGLDGTTFSADLITLTNPTTTSIEAILIQPGQWVKQGETLMTLKVIDPAQVEVKRLSAADTTTATSEPSASKTQAKEAKDAARDTQQSLPTSSALRSTPQSSTAATANPQQDAINPTNSADAGNKTAMSSASSPEQSSYQAGQLLNVNAPFSGRIDHLYPSLGQRLAAKLPLVKISNPQKLKFIGALPIEAKPQLSIGQTVNFSVGDSAEIYTGQLSQITTSHNPSQLLAHVDIIVTAANKDKLSSGMAVKGRIDYGQIEVGTIVPKSGIHDADLSALSKPPYQAKVPIKANVWIIGQDQRLTRQPVEVIEYDPKTEQYLVAGISNDSLICLAPLPASSIGKKVIVS